MGYGPKTNRERKSSNKAGEITQAAEMHVTQTGGFGLSPSIA